MGADGSRIRARRVTSPTPSRQPPPPAGEPLDAGPMAEADGPAGAIVDIDGTLVDTSYHHTVAWGRAFAEHGVDVALWRVHRHNGVGGGQLVGGGGRGGGGGRRG